MEVINQVSDSELGHHLEDFEGSLEARNKTQLERAGLAEGWCPISESCAKLVNIRNSISLGFIDDISN